MREEAWRAVLVVGHGSRREEANEDVREAARRIGERGRFPLIAAAFLEIVEIAANGGLGNRQLFHQLWKRRKPFGPNKFQQFRTSLIHYHDDRLQSP